MSPQAKGTTVRARLADFKAGTGRYAGRDAELERQARESIRARIAEEERLRAERRHNVAEHRAATRRLKAAARALPLVYGPPPGTEAVKAAVRRAKALCSSIPALQALEECAVDCALADVVDAVLSMKGAPAPAGGVRRE